MTRVDGDPPRTAVVVGAARGIGAATATLLADAGHRVVATWHTEPPADGALPAAVETGPLDVTDTAAVDAAFDEVEERHGPVGLLVCLPALLRDRPLPLLGDDDVLDVLDVGLTGPLRCVRRAARSMRRARWGRIVLVSSVTAVRGRAGQANYAAAKAGLTGLARSAARELGGRGITVNVVQPGPIDTELFATLADRQRGDWRDEVPMGRFGSPGEVASVIAFLCSERSSFVTGAVVPVDGGLLAAAGAGVAMSTGFAGEAQSAEAQSAEAQSAEAQSAEAQSAEVQSAETGS